MDEARTSYLRSILGPKLVLDLDSDLGITIATGVSQWNDLSGRNNHVAQATGATQPSYVANVLDGHAAVRHNGSQWLGATSFSGIAAGDFPRLYSIGSWTDAVSFSGALLALGSSAVVNRGTYLTHFLTTINALARRNGAAKTAQFANVTGQSSAPALFDGRNDPSNVVIAVNGVDITSAPVGASVGLDFAIDRVYVGILEDVTNHPLTGQTFKHIVVNPPPTAQQHAAIMSYLKLRYPTIGLP